MRLSTIRLPGAKLVRGSRLLRVIHPHQVDTRGAAEIDYAKITSPPGAAPIPTTAPQAGKPHVRAIAGDLAIEVVEVKTGNVLGYSYLTGEAIQCVSYEVMPHRFLPASLVRLIDLEAMIDRGNALSAPDPVEAKAILTGMIEILQSIKHSPHDVAVFQTQGGDGYTQLAQTLAEMWTCYRTVAEPDPDPDQFSCHLLGLIWKRQRKPSIFRPKVGEHVLMHLQPRRHTQDHSAGPFQVELLLGIGTA